MNERIVKTDDVEIKTVSIEIKAIKIGKKQMTQAVFKQLKYENILDYDLNLKGVPWGIVNYTTKEGSMHVIWQKGNELRRCKHKFIFEIQSELLQIYLGKCGIGMNREIISLLDRQMFATVELELQRKPEVHEYYVKTLKNLELSYVQLKDLDQLFIAV